MIFRGLYTSIVLLQWDTCGLVVSVYSGWCWTVDVTRLCSSASGWTRCVTVWNLERWRRLMWTLSVAWYRQASRSDLIHHVNVPCQSCSSCWQPVIPVNRRHSSASKPGERSQDIFRIRAINIRISPT